MSGLKYIKETCMSSAMNNKASIEPTLLHKVIELRKLLLGGNQGTDLDQEL